MSIENELQQLHERNRRVDLDKAWERSLTRRTFIVVATYVLALAFLWSIGNSQPLLTALIPAGGYFLSTLTLPFVRKFWAKNI
jgi:hypothetical protein